MLQGKNAEAELLYNRCQQKQGKLLGSDHPSLATTLNKLTGLLVIMVGPVSIVLKTLLVCF